MKLLKKVGLFLILFVAASTGLQAESLTEKFEKKTASEFATKSKWIVDFDEARKKAKKEGKPIFAYFTRSYSP
jgi:hypothetical protein